MFVDVGLVGSRPGDEVVVFDGFDPGGFYRAKTGSMEKAEVILDAMADTCDGVCLRCVGKGWEDSPESVRSSISADDYFTFIVYDGLVFVEMRRATTVTQFPNGD